MASVLLIDDCPEFRAFARCTLEHEGFDVLEARDALAGLQRAVEDTPDCVVVAESLAGLDGLDVASRIARDPESAGTPVLISTPLVGDALHRAALAAGAHGLVARSALAPELAAPIRELLRGREPRWAGASDVPPADRARAAG